MPVLKLLLIALLLFFPAGELIRFDIGNNIILKPLDILGVLIFFWTTVLYIKEKKFRSSLRWYFFFFPIVGLLSLAINISWLKPNELVASFLYLLRWISYMSIFFAVIQADQHFRKKIELLLTADGLAIVIIGFLQYFFYPSLKNLFYQGWDDHMYRLFSSFLDPNFVGAFYVLFMIFIATLLINSLKNKKAVVLYGLIIAATLIATFLTTSRSAMLMFITSGISFFVLLQKKKLILFLFLFIGIFLILASPYFYLENVNPLRSFSSLQRVSDAQKGLTIFKDHPFLGVGFNSYRYAQLRYHYQLQVTPNPVHNASGADNSFIFILATTGVVGFIAYCSLWYNLLKRAKRGERKYPVVFIASATGLFMNSFFNNSLFYSEIIVWMWMITGLVYSKD